VTTNIYVRGDLNIEVNVAGQDTKSVFQAAEGRPFDPPVFVSYASADHDRVLL
jgi:hypothetical protein